jgi:hypothetical protein
LTSVTLYPASVIFNAALPALLAGLPAAFFAGLPAAFFCRPARAFNKPARNLRTALVNRSIQARPHLCTLRAAPFCGIVFSAFVTDRPMTTRCK